MQEDVSQENSFEGDAMSPGLPTIHGEVNIAHGICVLWVSTVAINIVFIFFK